MVGFDPCCLFCCVGIMIDNYIVSFSECIVYCHPIGQLCLAGSGNRSHTVILYSAAFMEFTHYTVQTGDD